MCNFEQSSRVGLQAMEKEIKCLLNLVEIKKGGNGGWHVTLLIVMECRWWRRAFAAAVAVAVAAAAAAAPAAAAATMSCPHAVDGATVAHTLLALSVFLKLLVLLALLTIWMMCQRQTFVRIPNSPDVSLFFSQS